jgi:hypothetical protein
MIAGGALRFTFVKALLDDPSLSADQRGMGFGRLLQSMADTRCIAIHPR